jgi:hypothetical protein
VIGVVDSDGQVGLVEAIHALEVVSGLRSPSQGCGTGETDCTGQCVDTNADEANCGGCGFLCDPGQGCLLGVCVEQ